MRISDWSSDVCSSDLAFAVDFDIGRKTRVILDVAVARQRIDRILALEFGKQFLRRLAKYVDQQIEAATMRHADDDLIDVTRRSEEHTSELQSLMRLSYAVFCLKKKKITTNHLQTPLID